MEWTGEGFTTSRNIISSEGGSYNSNKGKTKSNDFIITGKYMTFFLELGAWDSKTGMSVFVDGKREFFITGSIMEAGRSHALDVSKFIGKPAYVTLTDAGTWERITLKNFLIKDELPSDAVVIPPDSELDKLDVTINTEGFKYINIPVDTSQNGELCEFYIDGKPSFTMFLRLAKHKVCDYTASIPVNGKTVRVCSENIRIPYDFEKKITVSENPLGYENFYQENGRPKFHFTVPHGGKGDMIGFYYYKGKYNIGYLYDSGYNIWNDNSQWAFSESDNLFKWSNHRILIKKGFYTKRSSGCGFVDNKNASGLKCGAESPILLYYSVEQQTGQRYQDFSDYDGKCKNPEYLSKVSVKYSTDGGKTFMEYENNPIFLTQEAGGHDPEVFYYEQLDKYIMVIHDKRSGKWGFDFYESENLLDWTYMSTIPQMWETPNMYPLVAKGKTYWILQQCDFGYYIGEFDGRKFIPQTELMRNYFNSYAMRTFDANGRRILLGSVSGSFKKTNGYYGDGCSTLPLEITLRNTEKGMRLFCEPVRELENFITDEKHFTGNASFHGGLCDLEIKSSNSFCIKAGDDTIMEYDNKNKICRSGNVSLQVENKKCDVRVILDDSVLSFFTDGGMNGGTAFYQSFGKDISISGADKITVKYLKSPYEE